MKRARLVAFWPGQPACAKRHPWGAEILHTLTPVAFVSVRTCTLCGATSVVWCPYAESGRCPKLVTCIHCCGDFDSMTDFVLHSRICRGPIVFGASGQKVDPQ